MGPCLQHVATLEQLFAGKKLEIRDHCFAFFDIGFVEFENMYHAEMDPAHLGAVIIQKRNDMIVENRLDPNPSLNLFGPQVGFTFSF